MMVDDYNEKNCDERHRNIREEFDQVWAKIDKFDVRLWVIIIMLFFNLGGIVITIVTRPTAVSNAHTIGHTPDIPDYKIPDKSTERR